MHYLIWLLPALSVAAAIASARLSTSGAALLGLALAIPIAMFTGPLPFGGAAVQLSLSRGLWIGATITPYILGGLLFWQLAAQPVTAPADEPAPAPTPLALRRRIFFACFLVGPFAESATGFGVGMLGTVALLRGLGFTPRQLMIFALLSQTLIPWGGMGSGTLLAAAYARLPATEVGLYSIIPTALLMPVWLTLFWCTARQAGLAAPLGECLREIGWIVAGLILLTPTTAVLGPETALLAAFGPLIIVRHLIDQRPDLRQLRATVRQILPYLLLITALVLTRLLPTLREPLASLGRMAPFADLPTWSPFLHAGSWMIAGGFATALLRGQGNRLGSELRSAWQTGQPAIMTLLLFAMMAEVLSAAGISKAFADGMFAALKTGSVLATPIVAGVFGILANGSNAPNSLFMSAQLALALQSGLSVAALVALQHVSGSGMSFFSPVRMTIAASLAGGQGQERQVYALLLPFAAAGFALLIAMALAIVAAGTLWG